MELSNIGIALSGGGIRATIFHLGVLKWIAEKGALEEVKRVSSVSGASLCIGMIYAHNNLRWPTSDEFLTTVLPSIENVLLTNDLQISALQRLIVSPNYWNKKVNILAKVLENKWGVYGSLSALTGNMMWYINCTTYETGKRFRFCRNNMGDYEIGYVKNPDIPLSDVMAASAGFPIFIGPYSLQTRDYKWVSSRYNQSGWQPPNSTIHLWDGGVYDNLGLESIFKPKNGGTLSDGLNCIIVSNASPTIDIYKRRIGLSLRNLKRLLDISMNQVESLRSRMVMDFIIRSNQGMYAKIGNSAEKIALESKCQEELKCYLIEKCLSDEQVIKIANYPTTLSKPTEINYQLLLRHGYEVAECTYCCYQNKNVNTPKVSLIK